MKVQFGALGVLFIGKMFSDCYYAKPEQGGFLGAAKAFLHNITYQSVEIMISQAPELLSELSNITYHNLEKIPVLVGQAEATGREAYKWGCEKVAVGFAKVQNATCAAISTLDEVVNLSPCLYNASRAKDYVAAHDFKTMSISMVHVVVTAGATLALPQTIVIRYGIIGLNIAAAYLEGNIFNSIAGLQTASAATKLGQCGYYLVEGGVLLSGIGISHDGYVKQHPGTPKGLVGSYQEMKADAFAHNCTYEDQYHLALHEYLCPA